MGEFKINFLRRLLLGIRAIYCLKRNFTIVFESKLYLEQILDLFISIARLIKFKIITCLTIQRIPHCSIY